MDKRHDYLYLNGDKDTSRCWCITHERVLHGKHIGTRLTEKCMLVRKDAVSV